MLDIGAVRREPDRVRHSAQRRGQDDTFVDEILRLDAQYRSALTELENAKGEKNRLSAQIAKAEDKAAAARELKPNLEQLSARIDGAEVRARALSPDNPDSPLRERLSQAANILDDSVPSGNDESANVMIRTGGEKRAFDFAPLQHWELGERLGILDFERAAKLSGSRFSIIKGQGARLSRALVQFFLDSADRKGYLEVDPPILVSRRTMWSTGQLTKFSDAMFLDRDADLFLIPTAEVPLAALHGDEIVSADQLPLKYTAYTPCFRKEAGAAGKDTRGLIRQHQFEKVELVWYTTPEQSFDALEQITRDAEDLLRALGLPYRVVALCAGDTSFNAAKTYDLEVWLPSASAYREISSCSNDTDFQARRGQMRFRRDAKSKPELMHTLNGSGLAVGRTLLAIMENYQQRDGSITIPEVLREYMGIDAIR